ncbi:hypothetical protein ACIP5U_38440 [Streptomyces sp. NPDC088788]|uniref:hypothetical protein n=1 Tax=Streptomyces sp. NPDC088788 TaxID=3365898 RepID=UPI0038156861
MTVLDRLRQKEPELRDSEFDLDEIAGRVMLKPPGEVISLAAKKKLLQLSSRARARNLADLSAFYLENQGAFNPIGMITDSSGQFSGRDWTGQGHLAGLDLGRTAVTRIHDGKRVVKIDEAPWGTRAYLLGVGAVSGGVVRTVWGNAPVEVLVALIGLDPRLSELPPDAPFVLTYEAHASGNLALQRELKCRFGREVWSANAGPVPERQLPPGSSPILTMAYEFVRPRWVDWASADDKIVERGAEQSEEGPSRMMRVLPSSWADEGSSPSALQSRSSTTRTLRPWSVPGWRVTGAPETVHFAQLYIDREWRNLSYQFELDLADALAVDLEAVQAAAHGVRRLHQALAEHHGTQLADSAFFADNEFQQWTGQPNAVSRFLDSEPPLPEMIKAFLNAAYDNRGPITLHATLPGLFEALREPQARGHRQQKYRFAHDLNGFRYVGGVVGPALWMLQAYQALGASGTELTAFRKALLAWSILTDTHSLHEVLRASHMLEVGVPAERVALSRDGARLHQMTARIFGLGPTLPHHRAYELKTQFLSQSGVNVPKDLAQAIQAAQTGEAVDEKLQARVDVTTAWIDRFGDRGRESLRSLTPAHLAALYIYTCRDYKLFHAYVNNGRFGDVVNRRLMRQRVWRYVEQGAENRGSKMPELLNRDLDFQHAIVTLRRIDLDYVMLRDIRRKVDRLSDKLFAEMAMHVEMVVEALSFLPPVDKAVFWGGELPGPLGGTPTDSPILTENVLYSPRFRSTTENIAVADQFVENYLDEVGDDGDRHAMRGYVSHSNARSIVPFSAGLDEEEVLYPPGVAMRIVGRNIMPSPGTGRDIVVYELQEMPSYPSSAYSYDEGEISPLGS